ncbi:carboxypeptidase s precursor [Kockovaella imperatae]|uniref:Carboxypeptidase s n=1 Tax=Kockovaella imperatae TaxID=4999 RepID=A0A1Y1U8C2_9TREE|nr:carboxypeptidase s precursor [Kockovaella imperatae]ORX33794.1 carboxypeptidase s precursor [Kockovaella imperatae]
MEKNSSLPRPVHAPARRASRHPTIFLGILLALATTLYFGPTYEAVKSRCHSAISSSHAKDSLDSVKWSQDQLKEYSKCPVQPKPLHPKMTWEMTSEEKERSIKLYSEAVQIPTQSYDDNGEPGEDERWAPFFDFQKWLNTTFPLATQTARIEYINKLGILATFEGSDPSLKPLLLMSHYDVVPAPPSTYDRWTYPPFSGHIDDEFVWGRGAADDKTLLVAQWESITHLLENGFKPRRTLILSHGFDEEEVFARRGQGHIAPFLEERYGNDGLLMVIDEGSGASDDFYGGAFALPAMGEKGYMDIEISVGTAGGHSSVPPTHTGIGIMSQIVLGLEDHPFSEKLTPATPMLQALMCAKDHAPSFPHEYSKLLKKEGPKSYPKLAQTLSSESLFNKAMLGTTTAVDVFHGGVKVNALPELVKAQVNFRIDFTESIQSTKDHVARILKRVAKKNSLQLSAWEGKDGDKDLGGRYIKVELIGKALEPAPRTPSSGGVWELFAGTVKSALPAPDGSERIVTPYHSTGNTDCKMYYNLTKHVYRFMGSSGGKSGNAHTVDERASIASHFQIISWIHAIIQNADAYDGEQ